MGDPSAATSGLAARTKVGIVKAETAYEKWMRENNVKPIAAEKS